MPWKMEMVLVILESLLRMTNIYEKAKTFGIFESRKLRENVDAPFGLQRFFIYIIIADKFLAQTKL